MPRKRRQAEPPKAPTPSALDLVQAAANDPNLTPKAAAVALARMALHMGIHDVPTLAKIGPALGHLGQGLGKVVAAEKGTDDTEDGAVLKAFLADRE